MKKICACLIGTVSLCLFCFGLNGCGVKNKKISSASDLYSMNSNNSYELTCDIDLNGQVWSPLKVKYFNGNGHKISNAVISCVLNDTDSEAGFFSSAYGISNVTFDNISVTANFSSGSDVAYPRVGIVCGFTHDYGSTSSSSLENITVKNSTLVFTSLMTKYCNSRNSEAYVGAVCAYNNGNEIKNCTVENCNINFTAAESGNYWVHMGGIEGYSSWTSNTLGCKLLNSTISCTGLSNVNLGGILGEKKREGNIENCVAVGNEIVLDTANADYGSRAGLIVGNIETDKSEMLNCGAKNNGLEVKAKSSYTVGGLAGRNSGTIKNCLSDNNTVKASITENNDAKFAYCGGLCGSNGGTVSRSVAQNCTVAGTESGTTTSGSYNKYAAGFVGYTSASISYSGVKDNTVTGGLTCRFSPNDDNYVFNCIKNPSDEDWINVIGILKLDEKLWNYYDGLKLNVLEN